MARAYEREVALRLEVPDLLVEELARPDDLRPFEDFDRLEEARPDELFLLDELLFLDALLLVVDDRRFDVLRERFRPELEARSDDGTSALTTALVSVGICFSRKEAMRSSWRRMSFAIFAVSVSPSAVARVSIAV